MRQELKNAVRDGDIVTIETINGDIYCGMPVRYSGDVLTIEDIDGNKERISDDGIFTIKF